ncbi:SH3 domain-containing protein [Nodosilinea sp. LEGE 07298]|uniref:SH3 domain-containing protein n=1 Tax=Nodosilinea sp. LEGE 07298 TaxID=2777970 RepID=UPI00187E3268|nr:SH3 domain-containing protein [Nodosilinea sp. LEGE 07298]MBE9113987.1 SH3 domain-containing protein [Nodosilinea sp. LEGE 07298]
MVRGKGWMALALCGVLSLTAIGCRDRNDTVVEAPPAADEQPVVSDPTEPTPETPPTPTPAPANPPEPGVGGTGEAVNPPQAAQLIAAQPEAQINLRSQPTTSSSARGYGLVGDPVELMRSADRSDGTWYFVKFEESGAEGWIRGDFINTEGRATPLSQRADTSSTCEGLMDGMTVTAFYDANGFHLVRFVNMETKNTFDATLSRQGSSNQGQPLYQGSTSPPTSDRSYPVSLTDLSGGTPRSGSRVNMSYAGIEGSATCE